MKKGTFAVILMLALVLLTGCGGSLEKDLQGSWRMIGITYPSAEGIEEIDSLLDSMNGLMEGSVLTMTYTYDHGKITQKVTVFGFQQTTEDDYGTYTLNGNKITITAEGRTDTYTLAVDGSTMTQTDENGIVTNFTRE